MTNRVSSSRDCWECMEGMDADAGENAMTLFANDLPRCQKYAEDHGYGGFAVWNDVAFFRASSSVDLRSRMIQRSGVKLYLFDNTTSMHTAVGPSPRNASTRSRSEPPIHAANASTRSRSEPPWIVGTIHGGLGLGFAEPVSHRAMDAAVVQATEFDESLGREASWWDRSFTTQNDGQTVRVRGRGSRYARQQRIEATLSADEDQNPRASNDPRSGRARTRIAVARRHMGAHSSPDPFA